MSVAIWLSTIAAWLGRWFASKETRSSAFSGRARPASRLGLVALLVAIPVWAKAIACLSAYSLQTDAWLVAAYIASVFAILGALTVLAGAALRVCRGPGSWLVRAWELMLGASAFYALWVIFAYGLASFSFAY